MTLRVSRTGDAIMVSVGPRMALRDVEHFVVSARGWIEKQLAQKGEMGQTFFPNMILSLGGISYKVLHEEAKRRSHMVLADTILIRSHRDDFEMVLLNCLYKMALERCTHWSRVFADQLGLTFNRISIKDVKGRWGSCSVRGNINYNWRIILAPEDVLVYLCAHEVSHLQHMNHSAEFWSLVGQLCPRHISLRAWLKKYGDTLYQYG